MPPRDAHALGARRGARGASPRAGDRKEARLPIRLFFFPPQDEGLLEPCPTLSLSPPPTLWGWAFDLWELHPGHSKPTLPRVIFCLSAGPYSAQMGWQSRVCSLLAGRIWEMTGLRCASSICNTRVIIALPRGEVVRIKWSNTSKVICTVSGPNFELIPNLVNDCRRKLLPKALWSRKTISPPSSPFWVLHLDAGLWSANESIVRIQRVVWSGCWLFRAAVSPPTITKDSWGWHIWRIWIEKKMTGLEKAKYPISNYNFFPPNFCLLKGWEKIITQQIAAWGM